MKPRRDYFLFLASSSGLSKVNFVYTRLISYKGFGAAKPSMSLAYFGQYFHAGVEGILVLYGVLDFTNTSDVFPNYTDSKCCFSLWKHREKISSLTTRERANVCT